MYVYIYIQCMYMYVIIESNKYIMNIISFAPLGLSHHLTSELRVDPGLDIVPELLSSDAARVQYINYIYILYILYYLYIHIFIYVYISSIYIYI